VSRLGLPVVSLKITLNTVTLLALVGRILIALIWISGSTSSLSLHAQEASTFETAAKVESAADANSIHSITIGEYTAFLRVVAAQEGELQSLYNDQIQEQIDRLWGGDHFDYQVREGTNENAPLKGALQEEVACYYDWIEYGADSQAAATSATDDKKTESSPLMMWRWGGEKNKSPDEKKSSSSEHLSPAERTDQERRDASLESSTILPEGKEGESHIGFYTSDEIQQHIRMLLRKAAVRGQKKSDTLPLEEEQKKGMALAEKLKPPIDSKLLNWQTWAENIIRQANEFPPDSSLRESIALYGGSHAEWIENEFKAAWAYEKAAKQKTKNNLEAEGAYRTQEHLLNQQAKTLLQEVKAIEKRQEENSKIKENLEIPLPLSLDDFHNAVKAYPNAERFIINNHGGIISIFPQEANPDTQGRNRAENITITQTLRAMLEREYPVSIIDELLPKDSMIANPSDLSGERLKNIFQRLDLHTHQKASVIKEKVFASSTISENLSATLKVSENKTRGLTKRTTVTWKEALEATKKAHLARVKIWRTQKEAPEIEEARALWEQLHAQKKEVFEQERDPLQKNRLRAEASWAEAEQVVWLGRKSNSKAIISSSQATETANCLKAASEYKLAEKAWQQVIETKEVVLGETADDQIKAQIEAEIAWAKAEKLTRSYQAANCQARAQYYDPKNREIFNKAWKDNAEKIKNLHAEWKNVCQAYDAIVNKSSFLKNKDDDWFDRLEEARLWSIIYLKEKLYDEGVKFHRIAHSFENKALRMKIEDPSFDETWDKAIKKKEKSSLLMEKYFDNYKNNDIGITSSPWREVLEEYVNGAQYWRSSVPVQWTKARKAEKIADESYDQAQKLSCDDASFNDQWKDATQKREESADAWNEVIKTLNQAMENIFPEQQTWNPDIATAQYQEAYQRVRALELKAEQAEKIVQQAEDKAVTLSSNNDNFRESWSDAFEKNNVLKLALDEVVEAYKLHREKIPEHKKNEWDADSKVKCNTLL
jgi:predicted CopG family antitoxin